MTPPSPRIGRRIHWRVPESTRPLSDLKREPRKTVQFFYPRNPGSATTPCTSEDKAEIENPATSRVIVARIAFPENTVKAATEHDAMKKEMARRTLDGTKRVQPP